jgi:hypothetical protein
VEARRDPGVTVIERIDLAHPVLVYGLLAFALAVVFVPMSIFRLVDGDEGTYMLPARLVAEGQLPYHDFFYQQMYLLPYVYGAWMKIVGYSWYGGRLLSAAFSMLLGLLVHRQVASLAGSRAWGILAVGLFASSSLAFGWYPLVKTFVLPTMLLFAGYAVLSTRSRWKWFASGLLVGLSIACRVYVVAVVPAFLVEIYLTEPERRARLMQFAHFALGGLIALLPVELFFLIDPQTFVFDIVGSQIIRTDYDMFSWWYQKLAAPMTLMALGEAEGLTSLQFVLLFLLCLAAWVSSLLARERLPLASSIAILLILASFVPTPVYTQYFCMPLPFLLVSAVVFCATLVRENATPRLRHLLALMAVLYIAVSPIDVYRYTISGHMIAGMPAGSSPVDWKLSTIRAVGRAIDREAPPDRRFVISLWPGYFVETQAAILPGLENHFTLMFSRLVEAHEVQRFKLMSYPALFGHLREHTVDVVVLGNWTNWNPNRELIRRQVQLNGYTLKQRIENTEIYTLPRQAARR